MKDLKDYGSSRIDTLEMQKYLNVFDYNEFVTIVQKMEAVGVIKPVKSSKTNAKKPALFNKYVIIKENRDFANIEDELYYRLSHELNLQYYQKNLVKYLEDRIPIKKLSDFLNNKRYLLEEAISINERSFQIWGEEKFLRGAGRTLLKKLDFHIEKLNYYDTTEPLPYFSNCKSIPQSILLIENKDTYYTLRRYMTNYNNLLLGEEIGTVVYGAGKGIHKSFKDFELCVEPYLMDLQNRFLYLGDLDYEGIRIYEQLYESFKARFIIKPFVGGYKYMINKALQGDLELPITKIGQNRNIKSIFFDFFTLDYVEKIESILSLNKYIPQEILNYNDLKNEGRA